MGLQVIYKYMLRSLFVLTLCLNLIANVHAQKPVTGIVYGENGATLSGVLISQKGTNNGTISNEKGAYSIVVSDDAILIFSFLGLQTIEEVVDGRSSINVNMITDVDGLGKLVTTALSINRGVNSLSFTQQSVSGDELVKSKDINFLHSLSGKVAGVNVKKNSSGAGG